ncbi:uncharacterized protein IL334_006981 [Kwoniella shivajii]|uniref:Ornithine decarboxylase antizyme n=1 Tax=Kwoniella shivajii TaxID=564305 RepID=A0ABZ1D874_9TREE|nr:hypothetical protein IL334_006981 [Kwoniella shivajii]
MSFPTKSITINRNLRPAGASGNAGTGAFPNTPLLFSADTENTGYPPLAIARAGGQGGQIYVYSEDIGENSSYASFAGGGRQWGSNASESLENLRDSLTSYLHRSSSQASSPASPLPSRPYMSFPTNLLTPPSSFTQSVDIPHQPSTAHYHSTNNAISLPLTPISSSSMSDDLSSPPRSHKTGIPNKQERQVISLISSIFPKHFQTISTLSSTLEIVTPPSNVLKGFIVDHSTRTVFIHLPPTASTSTQAERPETLSPNFSQVLRPHDPTLSSSPLTSSTQYALDIRESLTALLDLASDALEASNLVLVLDRDEREQEGLGELLHSLMYVGGQVLKPPSFEGWEWDIRKWVLVGMEL